MTTERMKPVDEGFVIVRRQWNDWRRATYRLGDLTGLHMSDLSGGIQASMPREFLCGYVWCDRMIEGELAHSCQHGKGPHEIKVCVIQKDNSKAVYRALKERMLSRRADEGTTA